MKSVSIRSTKPDRKAQAPQQQPKGPPAQKPHALPLSSCEGLQGLIAERAYQLYAARGFGQGVTLDGWLDATWLDAQREILSQIPPTLRGR